MTVIPFIDIFAGPGGLSEGFFRFATFRNSSVGFESRLAIEKDEVAVRTLALRAFFREFPYGEVPDEYYQALRGHRSFETLTALPEWRRAQEHVWNATLGEVPEDTLHGRIAAALNGATNWVLLGGPPCQAYSLMGRARMTGVGAAAREEDQDLDELRRMRRDEFAADHRHKLYREYLRIVAVHQPAVFVMENVKGILSSRIKTDDRGEERVFEHIRRDLSDPWAALDDDPHITELEKFRQTAPHQYRLWSLVLGDARAGDAIQDRDFLIRSEEFGVPQKRHRVILLGVRDDVAAAPRALEAGARRTVADAIEELPKLRSTVSRRGSGDKDWIRAIRAAYDQLGVALPSGSAGAEAIESFLVGDRPALACGSDFATLDGDPGQSDLGRWYADDRLDGVIQHVARSHMASDLVRYLYVSAATADLGKSPSLEDWPVALLPQHRNVTVDACTGRPKAQGFSDRFKVQFRDEPASTVTSHIAKDGHYFIHPDPMQCRSLTVREAARLQTFPDNYYFCGNRTQQYHQVGNAVPPYLACQIAEIVADLLVEAGLADEANG